MPLPSHHLEAISADGGDETPLEWREVEVPSLPLPGAAAVASMMRLDAQSQRESIILGFSADWWIEFCRWVAELAVEQRFVPSISQQAGGVLRGIWVPWTHDRSAAEQFESFIESMPPPARAVVDRLDHDPRRIAEDAAAGLTDALVREILIRRDFPDSVPDHDDGQDDHVPFLRSLLTAEPEVKLPAAGAARVFRDVRAWLNRLSDRSGSDYQLVIRVIEPLASDEHDRASIDGSAARWTLQALIRSAADPSFELPVPELWRGEMTLPAAAPIDELQTFALRELTRARTVFTALGAMIENPGHDSLELSTREAYRFLLETAPILAETGIVVEKPEWWGSPTGRLGARLLLQPLETAAPDGAADASPAISGTARLGLQTLVQFTWQISVGDRTLSFEQFKHIAAADAPLIRVGEQWIEVREDDLTSAEALLKKGVTGTMTVIDALQQVYGVHGRGPQLNVLGLDATGWISEMLSAASGGAALEMLEQPAAMLGELRPYQKAGLSWLAFLDAHGLGACLADDMGLGKTIQLIALLLHERQDRHDAEQVRPTLVVAPMSVISNWHREIQRFAPSLRVHVHHGPERPVDDPLVEIIADCDVVLTTYGLVNRDLPSLSRVHWGRVVLDEAQYVKNTPTKQAQAVRTLETDRRVALTGTPIENRLSELWSIIDFLNPGYLSGPTDFRRRFALPIERHRDTERANALRQLIRPFVLRRLKTDPDVVPDLPDLVKTKEYAALTSEQARLYEEVVTTMLSEADHAEGMQRRGLVLAGIVKLKQICNHPANPPDGFESGEGEAETNRLALRSGKMKTLLPILDEIVAAREQTLIFTQYRRMGHLLARMIEYELNIPIQFMHGGTPRTKRQQMIDRFQDQSLYTPVFILSLRAGGVGLNLTAANHVVHYDRWWNPAVESQATDRVFRIGQTRTVHVHTLICNGTLEERIDEMLEQKVNLAERIVGTGDSWLTELSIGELRDLLMLRESALEIDG